MKNTKIEWATHTFNPWEGCTKISPACDHCYAEALMDTRMHRVTWGAGQPRKRTSAANWRAICIDAASSSSGATTRHTRPQARASSAPNASPSSVRAFARATPAKMGGAFMTLVNGGNAADRLVMPAWVNGHTHAHGGLGRGHLCHARVSLNMAAL